jgi:Kelch motif/Galactose oxidase, central domain
VQGRGKARGGLLAGLVGGRNGADTGRRASGVACTGHVPSRRHPAHGAGQPGYPVQMLRGARRIGSLAAAAVLATLLAPPLAGAIDFGSFTPTGSLGTARSGASGALLPDGRVLIAGGYFNFTPGLSSAEVFDPAAGSFSSAGIGSMDAARLAAAAARLPDGRVLIAGGLNDNSYFANALIFDPATNSFSVVGSPGIVPIGLMSTPRFDDVAAPLPDGRVLIAGGSPDGISSDVLASAEVFNPATQTFSSAGIGSMSTPRAGAVAAPLPDGRVLIAGGYHGATNALPSAEVFDPATNSFSATGIGSMTTSREGGVAAPLPDGRVLIAGGLDNAEAFLSSAEVFNPATNSFSSLGIGSMSTPRLHAAAAPLPDGRVLVAGGYNGSAGALSSAEIYGATNVFYTLVKGLKLQIKVTAFGQVKVSDAAAKAGASVSKRRRRRLLLRPSKVSGGPGTIVIRLRLTRLAKRTLRKKGRVRVRARITFAPQGGLANTRTVRLKLKAKRRKSRRGL